MKLPTKFVHFYKRLLWCWHQDACPCKHIDWERCPCVKPQRMKVILEKCLYCDEMVYIVNGELKGYLILGAGYACPNCGGKE